MFDRIAGRYDLLNRLMSFGTDQSWRRATVKSLELPAAARVLDLATGTADLAIRVARTAPDCTVVGLDPSVGMLEVGQRKLAAAGLESRVSLIRGDAEQLPFENAQFDGITMAFGIRNVPDRLKALKEMARVLRPSGRVALLELSAPRAQGLFGTLARWHVRSVVPWMGALLSGASEYRYLEQSIAAFPPAEQFQELIAESGLEPLSLKRLGFGACHLYVATVRGT